MILHVPHSSSLIPEQLRDQVVISDSDLSAELILMTDCFTDEIFALAGVTMVRFPFSRLVVDVERFPDDTEEPMSRVGMGMIYTRTASGRKLRRTLQPHESRNLVSTYEAHHDALSTEVRRELARSGNALIVDCHSFPSQPLPCDSDQSVPRPDFCIGTDPFHTPTALVRSIALELRKMRYVVGINRPYTGALVPLPFYRKDRRVKSIMIEVNRHLYMDEPTGTKLDGFTLVKTQITGILSSICEFEQQS
jgi:N-formylglutamate amidohydrolase